MMMTMMMLLMMMTMMILLMMMMMMMMMDDGGAHRDLASSQGAWDLGPSFHVSLPWRVISLVVMFLGGEAVAVPGQSWGEACMVSAAERVWGYRCTPVTRHGGVGGGPWKWSTPD